MYVVGNGKVGSLRPLDKFDFNNTSQSSIDPRIKYSKEGDMIPLMPGDLSSHSLAASSATTPGNSNNSNSNANNDGNGNVTTQIPMCEELEVETSHDSDQERWYTIFLQILFRIFFYIKSFRAWWQPVLYSTKFK